MMTRFFPTLLCGILLGLPTFAVMDLSKVKLPPGFQISLYAEVPGARSLALSPQGVLYVGSRAGGAVYRVREGRTEKLATGLNSPNGVAIKGKDLYVAEIDRILVFKDVDALKAPTKAYKALSVKFPSDRHHGWKFIRFSPDGDLYVPVGAPCNICDEGGDYAKIFKVNIEKGSKEMVAQGVRNTVGFDFHPVSRELWFTDNGRDYLGEDQPPDEVNRLKRAGAHFGYPYCHGKNILDPEFGKGRKCADYVAPVVALPAHVAALGMRFYMGRQFPESYRGSIIVAEHGSWNRKIPQGYRLTLIQLKGQELKSVETFADGFLSNGKTLGRPVDVEILSDGSLLVSDDYGGGVYKITYVTPQQR